MNKKESFFKDKFRGQIMKEFFALRTKRYSYLAYNDDDLDYSKYKKAKGTKKCVLKRRLKFDVYKDCLLNDKTMIKSQKRFKSEKHDLYTEKVNKIVLSSNDDKRLQTFDKITIYPYEKML